MNPTIINGPPFAPEFCTTEVPMDWGSADCGSRAARLPIAPDRMMRLACSIAAGISSAAWSSRYSMDQLVISLAL